MRAISLLGNLENTEDITSYLVLLTSYSKPSYEMHKSGASGLVFLVLAAQSRCCHGSHARGSRLIESRPSFPRSPASHEAPPVPIRKLTSRSHCITSSSTSCTSKHAASTQMANVAPNSQGQLRRCSANQDIGKRCQNLHASYDSYSVFYELPRVAGGLQCMHSGWLKSL